MFWLELNYTESHFAPSLIVFSKFFSFCIIIKRYFVICTKIIRAPNDLLTTNAIKGIVCALETRNIDGRDSSNMKNL